MIREMEKKDHGTILEIVEKLKQTPEETGWFDKKARKKMIPFDIKVQKGFVAKENNKVIGFITFTSYEYAPFIGWIGVDLEFRGKGIGKKLVEKVEETFKEFGANEFFVETLAKEEGLGNSYEATYNFYIAAGFELDKIKIEKDDQGNEYKMALLKKEIK